MLEPVVSQLSHVEQYLIPALVCDTAGHDPWRSRLKESSYQPLEITHILFRSLTTILLLLPLIAFGED